MTLKKIGILCAMPIEAAALEAAMEQKSEKTVSGIRFVKGILDKKRRCWPFAVWERWPPRWRRRRCS